MNKLPVYILASLLFTGCITSTSQQSSGTVVGMQLGTVLGRAVGGTVSGNYESRLWGTAIGALTGAAVGNVINAPKTATSSPKAVSSASKKKNPERRNDVKAAVPMAADGNSLKVGNISFITETGDKTFASGEYAKLTFDVVNAGSDAIGEVQPMLQCSSSVIEFSEMTPIENLQPGEGVRYSVSLYANGQIKGKKNFINVYMSQDGGDYRLMSKTIITGE